MSLKHQLKRASQKILGVRTWMLAIIWVVLFPVMLMALRVDNLRMEQLRDAVATADETGDSAKISAALNDLRQYTARHMNSSTGVFYLQSSYERAVEAAAVDIGGANIYREATIYCQRLFQNKWSFAFIECVSDQVASQLGGGGEANRMPDPAIFRYEFIAPVFSFSVAGVIAALWLLLALALVVRLLYFIVLKISLLIIKKKS